MPVLATKLRIETPGQGLMWEQHMNLPAGDTSRVQERWPARWVLSGKSKAVMPRLPSRSLGCLPAQRILARTTPTRITSTLCSSSNLADTDSRSTTAASQRHTICQLTNRPSGNQTVSLSGCKVPGSQRGVVT
jgi:hypothetical protein